MLNQRSGHGSPLYGLVCCHAMDGNNVYSLPHATNLETRRTHTWHDLYKFTVYVLVRTAIYLGVWINFLLGLKQCKMLDARNVNQFDCVVLCIDSFLYFVYKIESCSFMCIMTIVASIQFHVTYRLLKIDSLLIQNTPLWILLRGNIKSELLMKMKFCCSPNRRVKESVYVIMLVSPVRQRR